MKNTHKINKRFRRLCKIARFVKKHINRKLGLAMLGKFHDMWSDAL